jgi:hypothetical protein
MLFASLFTKTEILVFSPVYAHFVIKLKIMLSFLLPRQVTLLCSTQVRHQDPYGFGSYSTQVRHQDPSGSPVPRLGGLRHDGGWSHRTASPHWLLYAGEPFQHCAERKTRPQCCFTPALAPLPSEKTAFLR